MFAHGVQMLRERDLRGRPIFYSLNSLLMEFELGEQRITPGVSKASASGLRIHLSRVQDATGKRVGLDAEHRFSHVCIAELSPRVRVFIDWVSPAFDS